MSDPHPDRRRAPVPDSAPDHEPGPSPAVVIRPGHPADADTVASLHAQGIDGGFLSLLGPDFLRRLYRRICLEPGAFLLVAEHETRVVGFTSGGLDVPALYRSFVLRDGAAAAAHAVGPLLRGWRRVLETLRHGSPGGRGTAGAEIFATAVDPSWQGRGIARRLVAASLDEVAARGCRAVQTVIAADNRPSLALYENAGFVATERFELHPGTESLLMRWQATDASAAVEPGSG